NPALNKELETVYEDDHLLVVNKPHEFLSTPGKTIHDSVATRMKARYPEATGPLIVHRLDMSTSGLMLIAKSMEVYNKLQYQFIKRTVKKRYVAVLQGSPNVDSGTIALPLRVDLEDRPRQLVCYDHGKTARTEWQVISRTKDTTRLHFFPVTRRRHQLREHAPHSRGRNSPIVADDSYVATAARLH